MAFSKLLFGGLFLLFLTVFSCSNEPEKMIEEIYPDGTPKVEKYYNTIDGNKQLVKEITYYSNHKKRYEGEYKNGKRNGKWMYWYENGSIWSEGYFKNDLSDGKRIVWRGNGKKYYEGTYKDGKQVGRWKFWDENGKLTKIVDNP